MGKIRPVFHSIYCKAPKEYKNHSLLLTGILNNGSFMPQCGMRDLDSVRPEMVDFGSEQGLSAFETTEIVNYFEDFKSAKTPLRAERCRLWTDTI